MFRLRCFLAFPPLAFALWLAPVLQAAELAYVKRDTREATRAASLAATRDRLGALTLSPWHRLGRTPGRDNLTWSPGGAVDLAQEVTAVTAGPKKWTPAPELKDAEWQPFPADTTWLFRTVDSASEQTATLTVGSDAVIKFYVNGIDEQTFGTTFVALDRMLSFPVRLKRGTNHLLVWLNAQPSEFFFESRQEDPTLLAALDDRLDEDFPPEGEQRYYRLETVPVPNGLVLEVGGLTFAADGRLMIATRRGDLFAVQRSANGDEWKRFATGLHEPLGIVAGRPGEFFVIQRPEVTRVRDTDGDGEADAFETITAPWGLSGGHHEYMFGPVRDSKGNLWGVTSGLADRKTATWSGWCFKVTPRGEFVPVSKGFRSSNGILCTPDDEIFVAENQGEYAGTSLLHHVSEGAFHGHPIGLLWDAAFKGNPYATPIEELERMRKLPAILLPYGPMGQSTAQPLVDTTGGKFGPFAGQMFVADQSKCIIVRVDLQKVGSEFQGAAFPFRQGFQSGNNRMAFASDGSLYIGQTDRGWGATGGRPYGLQRLAWTGEVPFEIKTLKLARDGFEFTFTRPVDADSAKAADACAIQHYRYLYHAKYGSPPVDILPAKPRNVAVSADGFKVTVTMPDLVERKLYEFNWRGLRARDGSALLHPAAYYTLNRRVK